MHFLINKFILIFFFLVTHLLITTSISAADNQFITIVNPVRGRDFFQLENVKPIENVKKEWEAVKSKNLDATWLLRPDALQEMETLNFFKSLPPTQEIGLFMEVTPTWAKEAGISYHKSKNWHDAGSVFLTGYSEDERHKLIDTAFEKYKKEFGAYPKSVGAWWIDAGSLSYMKEKYEIVANMDVADQYSTDNYQVWGQYFSTPFYPAKRNALVPASGIGQKLGVLTIQWATRDPYNSYGNGVLDSTYSVQANDYANKKFHQLSTDYFRTLLSIYLDNHYATFGQVTVGLENDFSWSEFGDEFQRQLQVVSERRLKGTQVVTMSQFARMYQDLFPEISPSQIIFADDPLGSGGKVLWYQNLRYRVGWFYDRRGSVIRDLRLFRESIDESCLEKACNELNLAMQETKNLDEVTFGDSWVIDEGRISDIKLIKLSNGWEISYKNQSGTLRKIAFLPNDIGVDNVSYPLPVAIDQAISASRNVSKIEGNYNFTLGDGFIKLLIEQTKNLILFSLFTILFIFFPGILLLKNTAFSPNEKFILSFPVGISVFTLTSFIVGYINFWWIIILLPIISIFFIRKNFISPTFKISRKSLALAAVVISGSISWLLTSVKNGLLYDFGLGFWGPHGHDAVWHLSIIESLKKGLPSENSIFAGEILKNYHYFYDLLLAQASNLTTIQPMDLYFRFFPIILSFGLGATVYVLAKEWLKSEKAAILSVFFLYFGGSFGWLLSYLRSRSLGGETTFWAQQGISSLINPPFAISLLLFLGGLFLFKKFVSQKQYHWSLIIPLSIMWGTVIEFKVYSGVLVLGSLTVVTLYELIKKKLGILMLSLPITVLSLVVFLPNNLGSPSLLVFSPFWLVHSMIDFPDRLNWSRLSLTRMTGFETGNWLKILGSEGLGLLIFILGNLGTRAIGTLSLQKLWSMNSFNLFIFTFLFFSILLSLLFIQKGANFNTIQFFYYFLLIFNFLAAFTLATIWNKWRKLGIVVVIVTILLTILTTWDSLQNYLPARPPAAVSQKEVEALEFLRKEPEGTVLSYFYDKKLKDRFVEPKPLFAYESTAYVSAVSGQKEFIADTVNLEILGVDYKGRLQIQKDILAAREPEIFKKMLKDNKISYLYLPKFFKFSINQELYGINKIFENSEVEIYKVNL